MSIIYKTIDDITRTKTSLDGTERVPARDNSGDFKITVDNLKASIVSSPVYFTDENYIILDDDNYSRIEVDTTAGDITITLPLKANNLAREIEIANVKGGTNKVIVVPNAGNGSSLSEDGLAAIWLPKIGDFVKFRESQGSGFWGVSNERITSQLRLNTYAGYGSTDNKIVRYTNVVENVGNMFSENHISGYTGNTKGLEITINRSGLYSLSMRVLSSDTTFGFSLNSTQLTTAIQTITLADVLIQSYTNDTAATPSTTSISLRFKKNDVIRPHTDGDAGNARDTFTVTYLGQ